MPKKLEPGFYTYYRPVWDENIVVEVFLQDGKFYVKFKDSNYTIPLLSMPSDGTFEPITRVWK